MHLHIRVDGHKSVNKNQNQEDKIMKKSACINCKGNEVDTVSMELCKGRHSTPATNGAIFETEVNPLDVSALESQAKERLANLNITRLHLYVTGLTVALIAVLNATRELGIEVILWHFDRESGQYYSQEVK